MNRRRPGRCLTSSKTPASSCWSTCVPSPRRAGRAFPRTSSRQASTNAASRICTYDLLHKIYAKHLKTPHAREELDELSALVKQSSPVCLLCFERDHTHCHRQWIAEIIEDRDEVKVENLAAKQV